MTNSYMAIPGLENMKIGGRAVSMLLGYEPDWIIQTICAHFGRPVDQINVKYRGRETVMLRRYLFYFLHKYTTMNKSDIGRLYGKDHTTIIHSLRTLENLRSIYSDIELEIQIIDNKINT